MLCFLSGGDEFGDGIFELYGEFGVFIFLFGGCILRVFVIYKFELFKWREVFFFLGFKGFGDFILLFVEDWFKVVCEFWVLFFELFVMWLVVILLWLLRIVFILFFMIFIYCLIINCIIGGMEFDCFVVGIL